MTPNLWLNLDASPAARLRAVRSAPVSFIR